MFCAGNRRAISRLDTAVDIPHTPGSVLDQLLITTLDMCCTIHVGNRIHGHTSTATHACASSDGRACMAHECGRWPVAAVAVYFKHPVVSTILPLRLLFLHAHVFPCGHDCRHESMRACSTSSRCGESLEHSSESKRMQATSRPTASSDSFYIPCKSIDMRPSMISG